MRLSLSVYAGLVVAILSLTPNAHASPITYEMSGMASGNIGGTPFTNALVDMVGTGDTANVSSFSVVLLGNPATVFGNPFEKFTITIAGVGTATITDQSALWTIPAGGDVLFGREDHVGSVPVLDSITGLGLVTSNLLGGYEGATAIGPITDGGAIGFPACGGVGQDPCVHTTLGLLSFASNITFPPTTETTTTFAATLESVPEPDTILLMGLGATVLVCRFRFRTCRSRKK